MSTIPFHVPDLTADIVIEVEFHETEDLEKIQKAVSTIATLQLVEDKRFDKTFLMGASSDLHVLQPLYEKVRVFGLLDTVRSRLRLSQIDNYTSIYFNKQAAFVGRLALLDVDDNPPLGAIMLSIVSDNLRDVINWLTPPTRDGKILSPREIEELERVSMERRLKKEADLAGNGLKDDDILFEDEL